MAAAAADLQHARALWLPSIFIGPNWIRHDGQAQVVEGPVRTISKSSLFLGATAAGGSSITGPVPAGGPAPVTGLTTVLRISDAIFLPLAARQIVDARRAGIRTAANDALLGTAESYMELQRAAGRLAIAREAAANAAELVAVTDAFVRAGAGLEGDHQRSLAERDRRLRQARLRPFVPSGAFRYSGGGFGGGRDEFLGDFASHSDADVNLYWETANLGFTDRAIRERRGAERRVADLGFLKVQDRVAAEVVQAEKARIAARRQLERMKETTAAAVRSVNLNLATIRRAAGLPVTATRPIEVLQPIQALAQARTEYLDAVIDYNVAQFRLEHALGRPPVAGSIEEPATAVETVARPEARGDAD